MQSPFLKFLSAFRTSSSTVVLNGDIRTISCWSPWMQACPSRLLVQQESTRLSSSVRTFAVCSRTSVVSHNDRYSQCTANVDGSLFQRRSVNHVPQTCNLTTLTGLPKSNGEQTLRLSFEKATGIAISRRYKKQSKKGSSGKEAAEEEETDDEEYDDDDEDDDDLSSLTFPEDKDFPDNYKEVKIHSKSLRLDAIVSGGLNIARNKVEDYFLESKLKLNGERVLKKSKQVQIGDYIDLVMGVEDGKQKVKRVRLLKVDADRTAKDKLKITVRAWKTAVPIDAA